MFASAHWPSDWRNARGRVAAGCVLASLAMCGAELHAAQLEVRVRALDGAPLAQAALVLEPVNAPAIQHRREHAAARMEQRERRFIPELLVVSTGTLVEFPNNDTVSHQVYSFSAPRTFQLPLYKGSVHPPVAFDKPGLVVLGCNIHDDMVAYIVVTDSPYHAQTDAQGRARIADVPAGSYRLKLWAPRIADPSESLEQTVEVLEPEPSKVEFQLKKPLLAEPTPRPERRDWHAY
jgi:plastocyanin